MLNAGACAGAEETELNPEDDPVTTGFAETILAILVAANAPAKPA